MPRPANQHDILAPPEPGLFFVRLVRKGPWVPARIIFEGGLWRAEINGLADGAPTPDYLDHRAVMRIWESGRAATEPEFDHALALKAWAEKHAPTHPAANPRKPIDLTTIPPLWRT